MIEDDFYATLKLKSGEEIFAKVAASDEDDRVMLLVHNPIIVSEIKTKGNLVGYKVEPWLKTTKEDMFIINLDNIITLSESIDLEMINMYQNFLRDSQRDPFNQPKMSRRMGYITTVDDARNFLEKIFIESPKDTKDTKS
tara:strand:+ start:187 stop:606 length:420 start_codon:yes stop_codon:yes gene_type:complete